MLGGKSSSLFNASLVILCIKFEYVSSLSVARVVIVVVVSPESCRSCLIFVIGGVASSALIATDCESLFGCFLVLTLISPNGSFG